MGGSCPGPQTEVFHNTSLEMRRINLVPSAYKADVLYHWPLLLPLQYFSHYRSIPDGIHQCPIMAKSSTGMEFHKVIFLLDSVVPEVPWTIQTTLRFLSPPFPTTLTFEQGILSFLPRLHLQPLTGFNFSSKLFLFQSQAPKGNLGNVWSKWETTLI